MAPSSRWRRIQLKSRACETAAVTTIYLSSASRVTVRSASMPPALIEKLGVDHLADRHRHVGGADPLQLGFGVAPLDHRLAE